MGLKIQLNRKTKIPTWLIYADPKTAAKILKVCDLAKRDSSVSPPDGSHCITLTATPRHCDELDWIMMKHPAEMSPEDRDYLYGQISADKVRREVLQTLSERKDAEPESEIPLDITLYPTQKEAVNLVQSLKRLLIGDPMGAGKTAMGVGVASGPGRLPALVVCPVHLMHQWETRIREYSPYTSVVRLEGTRPYHVDPTVDYVITAYTRIHGWLNWLVNYGFKTVIFDEIHNVRRTDTQKNTAARILSEASECVVGLSGSPIFNYADDMYHVVDVVNPGYLGSWKDFADEWCAGSFGREAKTIVDPHKLGTYLRTEGLMIRRTYEELGIQAGKPVIDIVTIDASIEELQKIEAQAIKLAQKTLTAGFEESGTAAREFNAKLRHATGCAKVVAAAEFVEDLLDQDVQKVVVVAHHHDVYNGLTRRLQKHGVVRYTGLETPAQKQQNIRSFLHLRDVKILLLSVLSGEGLDGLQAVCNNMVIVEPDWSPSRHAQIIGRLDRPGQNFPVYVNFLMIDDGSDPPIMEMLGMKRAMRDGVVDLVRPEEKDLVEIPTGRIAAMAESYLANKKKAVFEGSSAQPSKLGSKIATALAAANLPAGVPEKDLGDAVAKVLEPCKDVIREFKIDDENRIDFKVGDVGVELKVGGDRSAVYRQLLRYSSTFKELVLVCPWPLSNMAVEQSYCHVVCYTKRSENLA